MIHALFDLMCLIAIVCCELSWRRAFRRMTRQRMQADLTLGAQVKELDGRVSSLNLRVLGVEREHGQARESHPAGDGNGQL